MIDYHLVLIGLVDVDDMSKGGNDVDVDAAALGHCYPSSVMLFWNDIAMI